jgi:hypothetical protein
MPGYGLAVTSSGGTTGASNIIPPTSPISQFYFYNATHPTSSLPLAPGATTIIKSAQTGQFCRLVPATSTSNTSPTLVMVCDVTDPSQATPLTYTSTGLTYNGQSILPVGPGGQLAVLPPGSTTAPQIGTPAGWAPATPAGPAIAPGRPFNIQTSSGYVSVGPGGAPLFTNNSSTGQSLAEQFTLQHISNSSGPIYPGNYTYIKSELTGKYCRLVPGTAPGSQVVVCDLSTTTGATPLKYTGSGLTYNGQPLLPAGNNLPLTLGPGTAVRPTGSGSGTRFVPPPTRPPPPHRRSPPPPRKAPPPKPASKPPPRVRVPCRTRRPPPHRRSPPPKAGCTKAKFTPTKSATGGKPVASATGKGKAPPPVKRAAQAPAVTAAKQRAPVPAPPPQRIRPLASAPGAQVAAAPLGGAASCRLQVGARCGGFGMCGVDGACQGHCCSSGSTCTRHSAFTWTCR